ncbi:NAD(P)/FAD-dependent oxidoreductase [Craurococcus roseus]
MPLDTTTTAAAPDAPSTPPAAECDVLVIGGGPAGSTTAALLAERGRRVVLVEKDVHPRFHIGESLLPQNLRVFERLGLREDLARIGVFKPGAAFVSDAHDGKQVAFPFAEATNRDYTHSYQVKRAEFDEMLFRNAAARGAEAHEGMRVTEVALDAARGSLVTAEDARGNARTWRARFVVDASGRDTFFASRMGSKKRNSRNNTAALFSHFKGVKTRDGSAEEDGYIGIHLFEHGWFWFIPLQGGIMSVGVVSDPDFFKRRRGTLDEFLREAIAMCPSTAARARDAEMVMPAQATGNYSYRSDTMAGDGWLMVGDAFAFIDPVFSSGVCLAMASGDLAADAVHTWLDDRAAAAPALRRFEKKVRGAIGSLSWLIYRINDPVMRDMFMAPSNRFRMREGLVSMLAGDVHRNPHLRVPVLAFKTCYYGLRVARRLGWRPDGAGMVRVATPAAPATAAAEAGATATAR